MSRDLREGSGAWHGAAARFFGVVVVGLGIAFALVYYTPEWYGTTESEASLVARAAPTQQFSDVDDGTAAAEQAAPLPADTQHETVARAAYIPTPDSVRTIYMTQCVVGTPSFREELVQLVEETELNSIIIDIKDYTGGIAFPTEHPALREHVSDKCGARDMREFIARLHEKGVYVIGRITVFQDPHYATHHPELAVHFESPTGTVWKDNKGLSFIDVGATPFWEYIVALSRESYALGFDELNYDYIRYPSDGPMSNIAFPWTQEREKEEVLEEFFSYLQQEMKDLSHYPEGTSPPVLSADLFGMTTTAKDDMNIGQVFERALPYFDYIAPMVYPSHYPNGFNGWGDPDDVPYELMHFVLQSAVERAVATTTSVAFAGAEALLETVVVPATADTATTTKQVATGLYKKTAYDPTVIRPWIQDFDYGGDYGPKEVRAQIQAAYDVGLTSWMLWAPSNRYTREALYDAE
jgi:hypothetical protein